MVAKKNSNDIDLALACFQRGDLQQTESILLNIVDSQNNNSFAWFLLATTHVQSQQIKQAINEYKTAIRFQPQYPDAYYNLGVCFEMINDIQQAEHAYEQAVEQNPQYANALFSLGNIKHSKQETNDATKFYTQAIHYDAKNIKALNNLGLIYQQKKEFPTAIKYYQQALSVKKDDYEIINNLGLCYYYNGDARRAIDSFSSAIQISPNTPEIYNNIALAFQEINDTEKSIEHFLHAISLKLNYVEAITNLANLYRNKNQLEKAKQYYLTALAADPKYCEAYNNYGLLLYRQSKRNEAIRLFTNALEINPSFDEARYNLSSLQLADGIFIDGWRNYSARKVNKNENSHPVDNLNRESLRGKNVLLMSEQGIGDELFFLRFTKELSLLTENIDAQVTSKIDFLVKQIPQINNIITKLASVDYSSYDYCISIGDLPQILVESNEDIPSTLRFQAELTNIHAIEHELSHLGPPPYTAFTWRAGQKEKLLLYKEVPLATLWQVLNRLPGTLINLQRHPTAQESEELNLLAEGRTVVDFSGLNEDLPQILALLTIVDNYVGVSNTNMHLRHSVEKHGEVLVPHPADWRWMHNHEHSVWFPDFNIYRQAPDDDWSLAIEKLNAKLQADYGQ